MTTLYLLLIPPVLAALVSAFSRHTKVLELVALLATGVELAAALRLAYNASHTLVFTTPVFIVDALGSLVLLTVATVGFFTAAYSVGYLRVEVAKGIIGFRRVRQYFVLVHLFLFAMFFAVVTTAPMLMWIAIEATTLATAFLVSFYNKRSALEAAWKYLIINSVGLLLGFFGTLLYFTALHTSSNELITWSTLRENAPLLSPFIAKMSFVLVLVGFGTKIGLVPLHTWKPDTYSKAPTPIVALFSGALLNVALLALLRFKGITDIALPNFTPTLLIGFGLLSILFSAIVLYTQWNYKRLLAYSSIEHAGIIIFGFGLGGIGAFAALLHMMYHSLSKTLLFFAAGNIFLKYSSTKIAHVRGLLSTLPLTTIMLFVGFITAVGLPPFGIFYTELYIVLTGIAVHPYITVAVVFGLGLMFIGFLKQVIRMVYLPAPENIVAGEANYFTILPPLALLAVLVVFSLYIPTEIRTLLVTAARSL